MSPLSSAHHKMLARILEPVWLQRHLGWRITAPANENRIAPSPLGVA